MGIQWQKHYIHSDNYGQKVLHAHPNHMNTIQFTVYALADGCMARKL